MDVERCDDIFLGILQHCEKIEPFLETVFSFLARRTDFFRLMHNRDDKLGFPPGVAEKMVIKVFKKYQGLVHGQSYNKSKSKQHKDESSSADVSSSSSGNQKGSPMGHSGGEGSSQPSNVDVPPAVSTVEVETSRSDHCAAPPSTNTANDNMETQNSGNVSNTNTQASAPGPLSGEADEHSESKGMIPGKEAECYNGAVLDKYTWSQNIREVDIKVPIPPEITKAQEVGVEIKSSYLKVWLKKPLGDRENNILIEGKLQRTIKCEESMWSLEPKKCILINLEKMEERFWTAVLEGDPEIDKGEVDTTRNIGDFDEQTQSDFQRVMFDHQQKLQGKPTSQEVKTHEMLKKAWNTKGSPFAGTPFDPSKVNISPGSE